jgi:checkpoint serine/threonine-protein kinase
MPSPTVNTKLANEEVAMMFDQTIHGGKIRGSDSDSEDGSGSSEEEEPVEVAAPTPLPTRQQGPVAMLAPVGGMVPPTPTPASGHLAQNRAAIPMFQDENACAPPPSASKPVKFNVFGETPAKTPMAMGIRTPLALSASKPRAFGVLEEESPAPAPAQVDPTQSVKSRSALGSVNIFATPALAEKMPQRRALAHAILEEAEEAEEELQGGQQGEREVGPAADDDDERILQQVIEDAQHISVNDIDEEDDEEELPARRPRRFQIHEMTPITERTCEFTTHTTAQFNTMRSSALGNSSGRRTSARSEFDAGDEAFVTSDPAQIVENLSAVVEEEERPSSRPDSTTPTPDQSMFPPLDEASPQDYDRSGSIDPPFKISDGFTIHEATSHSMMLVDRTATMTMHTARDVSPEPEPALEPEHEHEAEADTGAFVTASAEQLSGHDQQVLSNPCNPADERVVDALLAIVEPPLGALPGFKDHRGTASGRLDSLQKHARNRVRRASGTSRTSVGGEDHMTIDLAGAKYEIWDKIGEGGYGAVFLAVDVAKRAEQDAKDDDDDDEDEDEEDDCFVAIKVEKPSAVWETVVLDRIHRRVDPSVASSIIRPRSVYAFADESFLVLDFSSQGTLLDLVNKATQLSIAPSTQSGVSGVDELVAMFFTIELLKLVEGLHSTGFIHGDLKIDNCLVRLDAIPSSEGGTSAWSTQYDRNGLHGWSRKGVKLIDFGGAIDTSLFPAGEKQMFVADWKTDERDCVEMREGRTWSYQTDYWGLASVAYCLLFGKYIQTEQVEEHGAKRYKIATPLKRVSEVWTSLYILANAPSSRHPRRLLAQTTRISRFQRSGSRCCSRC